MSLWRVILVFVKWPEPGRVKTRLGAEVGNDEAAAIYRQLAERVFALVDEAPADEIRIVFDPQDRETAFRDWIGPWFRHSEAVSFHPQASGNLGDRLRNAFAAVFENENTLAAAIGTDCIEIDAATFEETWSALESGNTDAVFGPARDGGYYLLGLGGMQPALFTKIPWSTEKTLEASLANAEAAGLRVTLLDAKNDIDTLADWQQAANPD